MNEIENKLIELIKISEKTYPGNSPEKIDPFIKAAEVYRQIGQPNKAIKLYEKVLIIQKAEKSTDLGELIGTMSTLSIVYGEIGNYREALDHVNNYTTLLKKYQPENKAAIYSAMHNIASVHMGLGDYTSAEKSYLDILSLSKTTLKAKPSSVAGTNHNLGVLYIKIDSHERAEKSLLTALEQKISIFGYNHKEVGMTLSVLSKLYADLGRTSESRKAEEESVRLMGYNPFKK